MLVLHASHAQFGDHHCWDLNMRKTARDVAREATTNLKYSCYNQVMPRLPVCLFKFIQKEPVFFEISDKRKFTRKTLVLESLF